MAFLTVLMPVRNVEPYIKAAIRSILAQTFPDFELWVLENGSSDETLSVARSFSDSRVRVFELGEVGFQGALGYGLKHATSPWMARMDGDDICMPTRFEKQFSAIAKQPDSIMIGVGGCFATPSGHVLAMQEPRAERRLTKAAMAIGRWTEATPIGRLCVDAGMIFNRAAALAVGGYDEEFTMGDVPLWLRMLEHGVGWEMPEPLYVWRCRPNSFHGAHSEGLSVRKKYSPEYVREFCAAHSIDPSAADVPKAKKPSAHKWNNIGRFELIAGDYSGARRCAARLYEEGWYRASCKLHLLAASKWAGKLWCQQRYGRRYVHRADIECKVVTLLQLDDAQCVN